MADDPYTLDQQAAQAQREADDKAEQARVRRSELESEAQGLESEAAQMLNDAKVRRQEADGLEAEAGGLQRTAADKRREAGGGSGWFI